MIFESLTTVVELDFAYSQFDNYFYVCKYNWLWDENMLCKT